MTLADFGETSAASEALQAARKLRTKAEQGGATKEEAATAEADAQAARARAHTTDFRTTLAEMHRDATAKALATAKAEGLTLKKSKNGTGYEGVRLKEDNRSKNRVAVLFEARKSVAGKLSSLGHFSTAAEAALVLAQSRAGKNTGAVTSNVSAGTRKAIDLPAPVGSTTTTSWRLRDGRPDAASTSRCLGEIVLAVDVAAAARGRRPRHPPPPTRRTPSRGGGDEGVLLMCEGPLAARSRPPLRPLRGPRWTPGCRHLTGTFDRRWV